MKRRTQLIKVDPENPEKKFIKTVVKTLKNGGIIAYPTDTCYGLGVDATNVRAIKDLRELKERPIEQPISIVVSTVSMAEKYAVLNDKILRIIKTFMPGPLTIVTHKKSTVPDILNKDAVSFRIPANKVALAIIKSLGKPLTAPSANPRGLEPAYTIDKLLHYFNGKIDMIVDAGNLPKVKPSTIVDLRYGKPRLLREGPVPFEKILNVWEKES